MKTKKISSYKTEADRQFVENWTLEVQALNQSHYARLTVETAFGPTVVWSFNGDRPDLPPLVFLPGARLCGLSWDLNDGLKVLKESFRLYLVDIIGQPGLSSGNSPDVKTDEFAQWLVQVLDGLKLEKPTVVGASFGGELALKLAAHAPHRIDKLVLMNPVGPSYISLAPRVTFYNLLPILFPSPKNVDLFMDNVAFAMSTDLPPERRALLAKFISQTLTRFRFKADLPYKMADAELAGHDVPTYLVLGDMDKLIPHQNTIARAEKLMKNVREIRVLKGIGHGIEMSHETFEVLREILTTSA